MADPFLAPTTMQMKQKRFLRIRSMCVLFGFLTRLPEFHGTHFLI